MITCGYMSVPKKIRCWRSGI